MATEFRLRRGTTAQHSTFTGAPAEVTVDTNKNTAVVHDGVTAGGFPLARDAALVAHTGNTSNPHSVTKAQVGLGNADNTSDVNKPVSTATQTALDAKVTASTGPGGAQYSHRNKIINGNFDIWQRGFNFSGVAMFTADRWVTGGISSTTGRVGMSAGDALGIQADNFLRHTITSVAGASNYSNLAQRIENVRTLNGKKVTVSFLARRVEGVGAMTVELAQVFGVGGGQSDEVNGLTHAGLSQKIALTASWQKFSLTFDVPSVEGKSIVAGTDSLRLHFWFDAGTSFATRTDNLGHQSGSFDIAQVQLEEGTVATPFEHRPFGLELALCQRYAYVIENASAGQYLLGTGWCPTTTQFRVAVPFPVVMRASPTATSTADINAFDGVATLGDAGESYTLTKELAQISVTTSGATQFRPAVVYINNAGHVLFSAEL